ncbi:peptide chain release factor N(5)-glutamine methyltransferase [Piscinibacter aquaticus]|uniref:Release factor glutamine methyltransferase n=1 Tax=Piscinibacter aquaticus TaxID=392597 RepID=A0A5C6U2M2_9BURK|nr:peptide chain release factor N(5)-glutamine methyltransferase [Piscinibacter aquaticus]
MPGRPLAAPQQGQGDGGCCGAAARQGAQRARREGGGHPQGADRQRRPQRPHPHLQLPARPADRSPHQPDAVPASGHRRRRSRRDRRGVAGGTRRRAAGGAGKRPVSTLQDALSAARAAGLDRLDAQLLLGHVLGRSRAWLLAHDDEALPAEQIATFEALVARRREGEPVAYLLGEKEFHGLLLQVDARVLVPRPDTEVLVDWALELLRTELVAVRQPTVADLGTGSGAIALAVRHAFQAAAVTATDASAEALAVARANGDRLGLTVEWLQGHWWAPLAGRRFDLVLSNPPYIREADPHRAALVHEPRGALAAGASGLDDLQRIVAGAARHLQPGGWLLLEHGFDQGADVARLLTDAGFVGIETRGDLAGLPRCTGGHR